METAVTARISAMAGGKCSDLDLQKFQDIEEDRNNKKRFLKNAKAALAKGEGIPSSLFLDMDDSSSSVMLTKDNLCEFMTKRNIKAIKEHVMQDCPEGAEIYEYRIHDEPVSDYSLAHVCNKIEERKQEMCRESKIVYKSMSSDTAEERKPASVPTIQSGATGARASRQ